MTDHDTPTTPKSPCQAWLDRWVWYCDETSIAAGKISALAIVETVAAVGVWWWLAMHFNWSIFSFIALFAAPLLLLRSPESIQLGVAMLKQYIKHDKNDTSKTSNATLFAILSLVMTSGLTYWLASDWLSTLGTADLFWWVAILSILAFLLALAFAGLGTAVVIERTNRWFKVVNTVSTLKILPSVLVLVLVLVNPIFALLIALLIALGKVAPYVLSFTAAAQDSFADLVARANEDANLLESASGFEIVFVACLSAWYTRFSQVVICKKVRMIIPLGIV
ncbi:MAG: hypothetical protein PHI11_04415 [Gallionella sp.]|nr:hypothetical protein [Gallionella sp.]